MSDQIEDTDPFENSYERIESLQIHVDDLQAKVKALTEENERLKKELESTKGTVKFLSSRGCSCSTCQFKAWQEMLNRRGSL